MGKLGLDPGSYVLVTMHRSSNVDAREALLRWLPALERMAEARPVVFPCHVRTRERLVAFGLEAPLESLPAFHLLEPLGYLEFLRLMEEAAVVVTDSGGIQEETTFLGVPCLTLRETTERPVTVELGTNRLVTLEPEAIEAAIGSILDGDRPVGKRPPLWDGRAAERIVGVLAGAGLASPAGRHAAF